MVHRQGHFKLANVTRHRAEGAPRGQQRSRCRDYQRTRVGSMSSKKPCSRCRRPMNTDSRGDLCRECWSADKRNNRVQASAFRKPQPPKRACSMCGTKTRSDSGLCTECSGEVSRGRGKFNPSNPNSCPRCSGLPWRRGEKAGDVCAVCGLAWEPEEMPPTEFYLRRSDERMVADGWWL